MMNPIFDWVIPKNVQIYLGDLKKSLIIKRLVPNSTDILKKNSKLKNRFSGKRVFILATGPSINCKDLSALKYENCISVSNFYLHPLYSIINPEFHCMAPFCPPLTEEFWHDWITDLERKTSPDTKIFFGLQDYNLVTKRNLFKNKTINFLNFTKSFEIFNNGDIDLSHELPSPQSVPIMALMVAIYLGFSKIYLVGVDHDHILHYGKTVHFYNESEAVSSSHDIDEWSGISLEEEFHNHVKLWGQYRKFKEIANKKGIQIFNTSEGGMLDLFPRIKLSEVLLGKKLNE